MGNLSSIRRKVEKLERGRELFESAPEFDPYSAIRGCAYSRLSEEELDLLVELCSLQQGCELNPSMEVSAAQKAAICSFSDAVQKECERFGISVAQWNERRGLAKPAVIQLKQQYLEQNRSRISFRNRSKRKVKLF